MSGTSDQVGSERQANQTPVRAGRRFVVLLAKAMTALAYVAVAYGVFVVGFFACCGMDGLSLLNPWKSPFGPIVTVLVVWPAGGFVCLLLDGGLEFALATVDRGTKWLLADDDASAARERD